MAHSIHAPFTSSWLKGLKLEALEAERGEDAEEAMTAKTEVQLLYTVNLNGRSRRKSPFEV